LTVKMNLPLAVSAAHATLAQLFFLITVSLAVFTSRGWREQEARLAEDGGPSVRSLGVVALVAILAQLVLGATLRHSATWDEDLPTSLLFPRRCSAWRTSSCCPMSAAPRSKRAARWASSCWTIWRPILQGALW